MVGHADGCAVGNEQVAGIDLNAAFAQLHDLAVEMLQVDNDAGAENVHGLVSENAGGHKVHDKGASVVDDGVAGVVAALIAHDNIILCAQQVDHTAFAFVAPVCAHYRSQHISIPLSYTFISALTPIYSLYFSSTGFAFSLRNFSH